MSAPAAGKFQDHYEVLGVPHKATPDAIRAAYDKLFAKHAGDHEKQEAVKLAFEVLSDPELRGEFNKLKGIGANDKPLFSGQPFFDALGKDANLRSALLSVLYDRRRVKPYTPSLSLRHLDGMLVATQEEMAVALWYLKKRSMIEMDDKSSLQITVEGIDWLESQRPGPDAVLPMLKPGSTVGDQPEEVPPAPAEEAQPAEPKPPAAVAIKPPAPGPTASSIGSATRIGNALARR